MAAWLVVAEHARSLVFVDYGELQSPGILAKGFYFLTGFGHEAVMVFFVISGYLVGGKVWSLYREGRFGWKRYLADRASRLYAVLFVALLLGAAMDWTGYLFFNKYGLYNQGYEGAIAVLGAAPIERMGLRDFLVNAFFLQTIAGPPFGSNGPLWSLAYEWWYYVLFPMVLAIVWSIVDYGFRKTEGKTEKLKTLDAGRWSLDSSSPATSYSLLATRALSALGSLLAAAGLCWFLTWEILIFFGVWLLGAVASSWTKRVPPWWLAACLLTPILLVARAEVLKVPYGWQYLLGVAFALVIVSLGNGSRRWFFSKPSAYLADFSYSVYLIHFPVLMFVVSGAFSLTGYGIKIPFDALGLIWFVAVFQLTILLAWIVSLFTERKTSTLKARIYSILQIQLANK